VAEVQAVPEPAVLPLCGVGAAIAVVVARCVRRGITSFPSLARRVLSFDL
jgi:hypothetical protein